MKNSVFQSGRLPVGERIHSKGYFSGTYRVKWVDNRKPNPQDPICLIFAGQGTTFPGMLRSEFRRPEIRELFYVADRLAQSYQLPLPSQYITDFSSLSEEEKYKIQNISLFVLEVGLANFLISKNYIPSLLTSHSFGEYAAWVVSGAISFEDMFSVVEFRERVSPPKNSRGFLIALAASEQRILQDLSGLPFHISNLNSAQQTVISVAPKDLQVVSDKLKQLDMKAKLLDTPQPYHSPLLSDMPGLIRKFLTQKKMRVVSPKWSVLSSVTQKIYPQEPFDEGIFKEILCLQMVSQVHFMNQVSLALKHGCKNYIEIGPKKLLLPFVQAASADSGLRVGFAPNLLSEGRRGRESKIELSASTSRWFGVVSEIIARVTGYKVENIRIDDRFQDDLGIDSLMRSEIIFSVMDQLGDRSFGGADLSKFSTVEDVVRFLERVENNEEGTLTTSIERKTHFHPSVVRWVPQPLESLPYLKKKRSFGKPWIVQVTESELHKYRGPELKKSVEAFESSGSRSLSIILDPSLSEKISHQIEKALNNGSIEPFVEIIMIIQQFVRLLPKQIPICLSLVTQGKLGLLESGLSAFMKSLGKEIPHFRIKHVHFNEKIDSNTLSQTVEMETNDFSAPDVRYENGKRYISDLVKIPVSMDADAHRFPGSGVVIVIGGGSGIGLSLVQHLSKDSEAHFYLLGRSAPEQVQNRFKTIPNAKNIHYVQANAAAWEPLEKVLQSILSTHGQIDLIINAAGVDRSHSLENKSEDEIRDEMVNKVLPAWHSLLACKKFNIGRLFCFSSIVSLFGNEGQTVYALANSIVNQSIEDFNRENPLLSGTSLNWPPWDGVGMTENRRVLMGLKTKGISLLPPDRAVELFNEELRSKERKGAVYYFDESDYWAYQFPTLETIDYRSVLGTLELTGSLPKFHRKLSTLTDPYLTDHSLGEKAYLPGATGTVLFLCAGYLRYQTLPTLTDVQFSKFIVVTQKEFDTVVEIEPHEEGMNLVLAVDGEAFSARAVRGIDPGVKYPFPLHPEKEILLETVYADNVFGCGSTFQILSEAFIGRTGDIFGTLDNTRLIPIFGGGIFGKMVQWIDAAFQLVAMKTFDTVPSLAIPVSVRKIVPSLPSDISSKLNLITRGVTIHEQKITGDAIVVDAHSRVILTLEGIEMQIMRALSGIPEIHKHRHSPTQAA